MSVILHHQSFVLNISQWPCCPEDGKKVIPCWPCPQREYWPWVFSFTDSERELERFPGWNLRNTFLKSWYENGNFQEGQAFLGHCVWPLANSSFHLPKVSMWWVGFQTQVGQWELQGGSTAQEQRGSKGQWIFTSKPVVWKQVGALLETAADVSLPQAASLSIPQWLCNVSIS